MLKLSEKIVISTITVSMITLLGLILGKIIPYTSGLFGQAFCMFFMSVIFFDVNLRTKSKVSFILSLFYFCLFYVAGISAILILPIEISSIV